MSTGEKHAAKALIALFVVAILALTVGAVHGAPQQDQPAIILTLSVATGTGLLIAIISRMLGTRR